jgi:hypothetical protein
MRLGNPNEIRFYTQQMVYVQRNYFINPLNAELNTICHLLALLEAHHILHVSGIRVNTFYRRCFQTRSSFRRTVEDLCASKVRTGSNSFP